MQHFDDLWKDELQLHLEAIRVEGREALDDGRAPFRVDKPLLYSAFIVRKLIEDGAVTDRVPYLRIRGGGYHTLTEVEIQRFEDRWPVGTKERLAFALLRYLGVRRSDVVRLGKQHQKNGWLSFTTKKGDTPLELPIPPDCNGS
ncbi:hypothetical protein [Hyphomicrobium facile]|uniref:hypothetical protein n=1 Tax=Hyphomicrobium facile TaxID=51670 RepID=UPI0015A5C33E|nr:hypothetical protein [Hyphomicrobium facile]